MSEPRGAGPAGGLLFAVVIVIAGVLAIRAVVGFVRFAIAAALIIFVIGLVARVISRR